MIDLKFGRVELKNIKLHHDDKYQKGHKDWYLSATYECENEAGIYEVVFPQIKLPFPYCHLPALTVSEGIHRFDREANIELWDGAILHPVDTSKEFVVQKEIKSKVHEMTISDIEKELGYKIKVVSEKEE